MVFTETDSSTPIENEAEMLSILNDRSTLFLPIHSQADAAEQDTSSVPVCYIPPIYFFDGLHIVTELYNNGDLFNYISLGPGHFTEDLSRYFFLQLVNTLSFLQASSIAHRDIKPENILLTSDFNVVLADFGSACPNHPHLDRYIGTEGYIAPELLRRKNYDGFQSDVFSLGVVLFCMVAGFPPYKKQATSADPYYRYFTQHRQAAYWNCLARKHAPRTFSPDFIDLISKMLEYNPQQRITIQEISIHPFINAHTILHPSAVAKHMKLL